MIYGYARVSTDGQSVDAQVKQLHAAGAEKVFRETASGARSDRAGLRRALDHIGKGDVLMVTRLDRLARSTRDLFNTVEKIKDKGAGFRSLGDGWADSTTAHGRLMLAVLSGLAEFETSLIHARTGEGRERARARGVKMGRKPKLTRHQQREARARRHAEAAMVRAWLNQRLAPEVESLKARQDAECLKLRQQQGRLTALFMGALDVTGQTRRKRAAALRALDKRHRRERAELAARIRQTRAVQAQAVRVRYEPEIHAIKLRRREQVSTLKERHGDDMLREDEALQVREAERDQGRETLKQQIDAWKRHSANPSTARQPKMTAPHLIQTRRAARRDRAGRGGLLTLRPS